jgi:hypothetical protein
MLISPEANVISLPAFAAAEIPFGNQTLTMISVGLAG